MVLAIANKQLGLSCAGLGSGPYSSEKLKILGAARWAPISDNTQPWRFEIVSESHCVIHGYITTQLNCHRHDLMVHQPKLPHRALVPKYCTIATSDLGLRQNSSASRDQPETTQPSTLNCWGCWNRETMVDFLPTSGPGSAAFGFAADAGSKQRRDSVGQILGNVDRRGSQSLAVG